MDLASQHITTLNSNAPTDEKLAAIDEMNEEGYTWWVNQDGESVSLIDWYTKMQLMVPTNEE